MDVFKSVEGQWRLFQVLNDDVEQALRYVEADDTQYHRRASVRAMFAAIEGTVYLIKQSALHEPDARFTAAELALLREEAYTLDSRGQVKKQPKFLPLDLNYRFALEMYAKRMYPNLKLELGDGGWEAFKQAIEIRHRLTHPKHIDTITVSDEEFKVLKRGYEWFYGAFFNTLLQVAQHLHQEVGKIKEAAEARAAGSGGTTSLTEAIRERTESPGQKPQEAESAPKQGQDPEHPQAPGK
jgi:hypothetical protein